MIHIVLYEPEIPENTGNIMRTCAASGATLHLIEPLGFIWDDKRVKRSVMDYDQYMTLERHIDWESFLKTVKGPMFFLTRYGESVHSDFDYQSIDEDIYLVFGKESTGIPKEILKEHFDHAFRIPMSENARSMNLANTVAIVVFEVLRQKNYEGLSRYEVQKGKHYLKDL
ncbi:tRNA (uridine(34)/cytosine(34)/5-carboxymethylaminomethyluridine(34)-2'-O)-methyltransferase TrmL [Erysipelothrix sp. HDW6A]|uniref:tRNA (uridine(34)/cytosine(34)/5- carboxymethylaminomethyluridine(34)-2'-O)- methyltransferase TrmL n=1 Tax=Erysipelothrix sp. HDW6A TaxID=2714928 RepID=UPI00140800F2|nr:tRNA (uridine(34)/cytosine(34)/5-carboxymethylaminomethyluridine(34)-2'-O)-methyltransferase TrmL [Erysipelothrix sp. HDW6A]QIK57364.1 tRNA (uridine(34)/cytosine(34)/5-carboxymethylaminomethyluridine(34)-2'-O)-methyltransferase TrmL [Erysipelothrix sp. HDW6A]